jgi:CheY-like chemotaxis protein
MRIALRQRPTSTPTVLIVNEDQGFVTRLRKKIQDAGYRPVWARDGREALAAMTDERPAVILMDENLPAAEASALMSKVDRSPALSRIPRAVLRAEDLAAPASPASSKRIDSSLLVNLIRRLTRSPAGA